MITSKHIKWTAALLAILQICFIYYQSNLFCGNKTFISGSSFNYRLSTEKEAFYGSALHGNSKSSSLSSFWWPSPESEGGFLSAIYTAQHSNACSSKSTKFFVLRNLKNNENDNRGLSAWASITMRHMLHAFSDGDNFKKGGRILIDDGTLWPMAKGCQHGPETRECYFLPHTNCKLKDVDPIDAKDGSVAVLIDAKDDYNRSVRTLYSSDERKYARLIKDQISWSGLKGNSEEFSSASLIAAFLAYYFQPQPWLREEIDQRLRRSLPLDLNPDRTLGVPIRRSDKCHGHRLEGSAKGELDCPDLQLYLSSVKSFLRFDPLIDSIIVTSEDPSAFVEFTTMLKSELPHLRIITNVGDVQQGTGSASKLESYKEGASNAAVVASALTSLHMHLRARYFVLTTKSSWTSSIAILARVYGFATDVYVLDIGPNHNFYSHVARKGG